MVKRCARFRTCFRVRISGARIELELGDSVSADRVCVLTDPWRPLEKRIVSGDYDQEAREGSATMLPVRN
jgi:hypothetical protein